MTTDSTRAFPKRSEVWIGLAWTHREAIEKAIGTGKTHYTVYCTESSNVYSLDRPERHICTVADLIDDTPDPQEATP